MRIEVNHASKTIKKVQVLEDVCLRLESGTVYGIEGPNGSGKTMLMRAILGLIRLDSGSVLVDGMRIGKDLDFAPDAGALIESPSFLPSKTGRDNLLYLTRIKNVVGETEVDAALERVGLADARGKKYRQYSLGMRQRLGIAGAILGVLMILDPFRGAAALMVFTGISLLVTGVESIYAIICISKVFRSSGHQKIIEASWHDCD